MDSSRVFSTPGQAIFRGGELQHLRIMLAVVLAMLLLGILSGCGWERRKSDGELGLNPQEVRGRRVFDRSCDRCHNPYGSWSWNGPSMVGLMKKQYLPSGTPANDERILEVIRLGKAKMPAFRNELTPTQLDDLMAYLRTL